MALGPAPLEGCPTCRSTASAAASASTGRRRLPPAKTLYRIASATIGGQSGGLRRYRSSASSTRTRTRSRKAPSGSVATRSAAVAVVGAERGGRRFQLAALVEDLDAALGFLEPRVAEARELHAALVELQRLFEREVALFEFLHDGLELRDGGLEVLDRCVGHLCLRHLSFNFAAAQGDVDRVARRHRGG